MLLGQRPLLHLEVKKSSKVSIQGRKIMKAEFLEPLIFDSIAKDLSRGNGIQGDGAVSVSPSYLPFSQDIIHGQHAFFKLPYRYLVDV